VRVTGKRKRSGLRIAAAGVYGGRDAGHPALKVYGTSSCWPLAAQCGRKKMLERTGHWVWRTFTAPACRRAK
jgi:hypothetical protein